MKLKDKKNINKESVLAPFVAILKGEDRLSVEDLPYKGITKDGLLVDRYGEFHAVMKIKTRDLSNMHDSDFNQMKTRFEDFNRLYTSPAKYVSLTYPINTTNQQAFLSRKIEKYRKELLDNDISPRRQKVVSAQFRLAMEERERMIWSEDHIRDKVFYLVLFASDKKKLKAEIDLAERTLGRKYFGLTRLYKKVDLENYVFKLMNPNTQI